MFKIDILECPKCGERFKVIAVLTDLFVVQAFLASVGKSGETPMPMQAPPWRDEVGVIGPWLVR